jgi:prepilin-type N-terminal cleavage/methylation domain-containing protein
MRWNEKGFSLAELMVVLVVLAVGLLPIAMVQTRSSQDVFNSGQRTEALNIAQMQMERTRSLGFNNAVADSGLAGPFAWRTDVQAAGFGLSSVAVTVRWQERGKQRSLTLNNLLSMR